MHFICADRWEHDISTFSLLACGCVGKDIDKNLKHTIDGCAKAFMANSAQSLTNQVLHVTETRELNNQLKSLKHNSLLY